MIVTDTPCWWFVAFDPRDRKYGYVDRKIERDWAYEGQLMDKVNRFIGGYIAGEIFKPKQYDHTTYKELFDV